jgi:hypothetical protein
VAVSPGKNFRRLLAQALAADEDDMRALVERMLPCGEDGKRALRLTKEDDRRLLPLAIVAAFSADAITGDEAEELKRQAKDVAVTAPPRPGWDTPSELLALSPDERRRLGYVPSSEPAIQRWRDAKEPGPPL